MEWVNDFDSSTIAAFCYDESTRILTIEFKRGGSYNYFDVPSSVFEEMRTAPSKGQFFSQRIKPTFRYARI